MKITVSTFKAAVNNGFGFYEMAADLEEYEWVLVHPANVRSMTIAMNVYDEGKLVGAEWITPVIVDCDCGIRFGTAILEDENSTMCAVQCPECGISREAYGNDSVEFDDSARLNRIMNGQKV